MAGHTIGGLLGQVSRNSFMEIVVKRALLLILGLVVIYGVDISKDGSHSGKDAAPTAYVAVGDREPLTFPL